MGREDGECDTASFVHRAEAHDEIALRIIRSTSVRAVKMNERAGGLSCGIDIQTLISAFDGIRNDCDDLAEQGHVLVEGNFIDFCVDITAHEGIRGTCKSTKKNSVRLPGWKRSAVPSWNCSRTMLPFVSIAPRAFIIFFCW